MASRDGILEPRSARDQRVGDMPRWRTVPRAVWHGAGSRGGQRWPYHKPPGGQRGLSAAIDWRCRAPPVPRLSRLHSAQCEKAYEDGLDPSLVLWPHWPVPVRTAPSWALPEELGNLASRARPTRAAMAVQPSSSVGASTEATEGTRQCCVGQCKAQTGSEVKPTATYGAPEEVFMCLASAPHQRGVAAAQIKRIMHDAYN